jgi:CRP-like cAMP-binding protein
MISVDALQRLAIFQDVPREILADLAAQVQEQTFAKNDVIVRQHDDAHAVYLLLSGSVQFLIRFQDVDDMLVGTTSEHGAPIGWSVAREPHRYTATVRCETPCDVLYVPRAALDRIVEQNPEVGFAILRHLAAAVAIRLEQARDLLLMPTAAAGTV